MSGAGSRKNPLVLDSAGNVVVEPPPRRIIFGGPPSLIRRRVPVPSSLSPPELRPMPERVEESAPGRLIPDVSTILAHDPDGKRIGTRELARRARAEHSGTPEASTSRVVHEIESSPEVTITAHRISPPSSPGFLITGFHRQRLLQVPKLTPDALWLTAGRPQNYKVKLSHHACGICKSVKAHPVSYVCGHSHCYPCIRVWLEHNWGCRDCRATMTRAPFRHYAEEDSLAAAYPGWGEGTHVDYSWRGLKFPWGTVIAPETPSP
ncbi:hypothetical protein C8F04DRAFT_1276294 [Mycena alexandri]|uniref:RING-type domain-containing protein n=1 Tax=Mycena alexandri TaxID=1745969 RepID=A0AAD6S2P5_9AGAR|nr:hypothetical protein C8F04DRAFT_1276294 [Mycena alexandri]